MVTLQFEIIISVSNFQYFISLLHFLIHNIIYYTFANSQLANSVNTRSCKKIIIKLPIKSLLSHQMHLQKQIVHKTPSN